MPLEALFYATSRGVKFYRVILMALKSINQHALQTLCFQTLDVD